MTVQELHQHLDVAMAMWARHGRQPGQIYTNTPVAELLRFLDERKIPAGSRDGRTEDLDALRRHVRMLCRDSRLDLEIATIMDLAEWSARRAYAPQTRSAGR